MKYPRIAYRNGKRYFYRFSLVQRIQHIILFTTVILLSLTGFPLRYYDQPWALDLSLLQEPDRSAQERESLDGG